MQYNSDSDSQDIVSLIGDATGINTTAEIKQITRAANRANKIIWSWIFESYGGWQYDDTNNTNLPIATTTLTSGQAKYILPSEALTVRNVEVKQDGGDTWTKLIPLPIGRINEMMSEEEFSDETGTPIYYALIADMVKVYPTPDYTQAASIRVQFDRGSVSFVSTDIEKDPGFVSQFHEAVADGASFYLGINKNLSNLEGLQLQWNLWEDKIKKFYAERFVEMYPKELRNGDYSNNII